MRPGRLLPACLLCLLLVSGLACVSRRQPPAPAGTPAHQEAPSEPVQPPPPHRLHQAAELWEFRPDGVTYDFLGCVEALKPGQEAIAFTNTAVHKGQEATTARWTADMELVTLDRTPYPDNPDYEVLMHVLVPKKSVQAGQRLRARYQLKFKDLPYLHKGEANKRLLSLTLSPQTGITRQDVILAIPENPAPVLPSDMKPTRVFTVPGWRIYRYEISRTAQAVIHLSFELTAPSQPLPRLEDLLPAEEAIRCP